VTSTQSHRPTIVQHMLRTSGSGVETVARLSLGLVLLPHGAQHLLGVFGGYGFGATIAWMTSTLGVPMWLAALAIVVEFVAPLALVIGVGARLAALSLALSMTVAASTHVSKGFFMNWFGTLPSGAEGFEYHVLAITMAGTIAVRGAGAWSVDTWLTRDTDTVRARSGMKKTLVRAAMHSQAS
jgi:putative oxidoreductase